jgi:hypothetical protein
VSDQLVTFEEIETAFVSAYHREDFHEDAMPSWLGKAKRAVVKNWAGQLAIPASMAAEIVARERQYRERHSRLNVEYNGYLDDHLRKREQVAREAYAAAVALAERELGLQGGAQPHSIGVDAAQAARERFDREETLSVEEFAKLRGLVA